MDEQISQREYIEDFQDMADQAWFWSETCVFVVGPLTFGIICLLYFFIAKPRAIAKLQAACESFNAKYSENRGVSIKLATKGDYPEFKVTVKQPGVAIPGVELFIPSDHNRRKILSYQKDAETGFNGPKSYGTSSDADVTPGTAPSSSDDPSAPLLSAE